MLVESGNGTVAMAGADAADACGVAAFDAASPDAVWGALRRHELGLRVAGLAHLTKDMTVEFGGKADTLEDGETKGTVDLGLGYIF